jgi:hypothetical protein
MNSHFKRPFGYRGIKEEVVEKPHVQEAQVKSTPHFVKKAEVPKVELPSESVYKRETGKRIFRLETRAVKK